MTAQRTYAVNASTLALRHFRTIYGAVRAHFRAIEREAGLGGAPIWALSLIAQRPGLGVGDVARGMDIHPSTASNLVRQLVAKGLVRSERAHHDARVRTLQVSESAQAILARVPQPFEGVLPHALAKLDARSIAALNTQLTQLIECMGANVQAHARVPLANL